MPLVRASQFKSAVCFHSVMIWDRFCVYAIPSEIGFPSCILAGWLLNCACFATNQLHCRGKRINNRYKNSYSLAICFMCHNGRKVDVPLCFSRPPLHKHLSCMNFGHLPILENYFFCLPPVTPQLQALGLNLKSCFFSSWNGWRNTWEKTGATES